MRTIVPNKGGPAPAAIASYQCSRCGRIARTWTIACPACGGHASARRRRAAHEDLKVRMGVLCNSPADKSRRVVSGVEVWDAMTGGGLPWGSVTLLGGEPGCGKSTLLLEIAVGARVPNTLYAVGEEQRIAVEERAERLQLGASNRATQRCTIIETQTTEEIFEAAAQTRADLVVVDSIQAFTSPAVSGKEGGVAQIRHLATTAIDHARATNTVWLLIGQINQDGKIAGPRKLPHWVDGVCQIYVDKHDRRWMKALKSRYSPTKKVYELEMTEAGLKAAGPAQEKGPKRPRRFAEIADTDEDLPLGDPDNDTD